MEYYRGILFLTSNCVGKFDDAITSRISLVIEFKNLTPEEKKKLRILYERKIREDKEQRYMLWDDACAVLKEIDDTTDFTYNGREIKNG